MKKFCILLALCVLVAGCSQKAPPGEGSQPAPEEDLQSGLFLEEESDPLAEAEESLPEESAPQVPRDEQSLNEESVPLSRQPSSAAPAAPQEPSRPAVSSAPVQSSPSLPAPARSTEQTPAETMGETGPYLAGVEGEIIRLINEKRASMGLSQLSYDADLARASRIRSLEMYQNNYFAHGRPNGDGWQTVLQEDVPVQYVMAGENLAQVEHNMPDYDPAKDAQYWYTTWENSPSHYENIVRPNFTHIGAGVFYEDKNGMIYSYATTIFASF